MLIFDSDACWRIRNRKQTRTTRPADTDVVAGGEPHGFMAGNQVQPGKLRIDSVSYTALGGITEEDAQGEGFVSLEAFRRHWERTRGPWDDRTHVKDIRFTYLPGPPVVTSTKRTRGQSHLPL